MARADPVSSWTKAKGKASKTGAKAARNEAVVMKKGPILRQVDTEKKNRERMVEFNTLMKRVEARKATRRIANRRDT
ncbi:MAG: hypothetical protein Q9184_006287 [Pyrenodesmia sp. 2 TL-2023]